MSTLWEVTVILLFYYGLEDECERMEGNLCPASGQKQGVLRDAYDGHALSHEKADPHQRSTYQLDAVNSISYTHI